MLVAFVDASIAHPTPGIGQVVKAITMVVIHNGDMDVMNLRASTDNSLAKSKYNVVYLSHQTISYYAKIVIIAHGLCDTPSKSILI